MAGIRSAGGQNHRVKSWLLMILELAPINSLKLVARLDGLEGGDNGVTMLSRYLYPHIFYMLGNPFCSSLYITYPTKATLKYKKISIDEYSCREIQSVNGWKKGDKKSSTFFRKAFLLPMLKPSAKDSENEKKKNNRNEH